MQPKEIAKEFRRVQAKYKKDFAPVFNTTVSNMAGMAADTIDTLLGMMNQFAWVPVTERLPEAPLYDWVLVRTLLIPEGTYGMPHIAELRDGVWYSQACEFGPMEEVLSLKVTDWFDIQLIKEPITQDIRGTVVGIADEFATNKKDKEANPDRDVSQIKKLKVQTLAEMRDREEEKK